MPYEPVNLKKLNHFLNQLREAIYEPVHALDITAWVTPEPVPYEQRHTGTQVTLASGERWGELWDCAWFCFKTTVPARQLKPNETWVLLLDVNGEMCVVDAQGTPYQGLTTVNSEFDFTLGLPGKRVIACQPFCVGEEGRQIELWADAGNNDLFGYYRGGTIHEAQLAICREERRHLYYDYEVLLETAEHLPEGSARREQIRQLLYEVSLMGANRSEEAVTEARDRMQDALSKRNGDAALSISAVGHAHIDLAWLWPIRETIRKGARTFSTVLRMMERYPDYVFGASQPQLYDWMKSDYPQLYAQIKERVKQGRWEPQGAMWVESDTNVPGGESLVRQLLYGKRFFQEEFGLEMKSLWMPDVFGYTASLPQLLKKAGVDFMMTQKLSWSVYNRHPHHSFIWEGIDGSRVLTHMPPEDTYNSPAAPRSIVKTEREYLDKNVSTHALMLFGIGDGGGGPGEEHLERLAREQNLLGLAPVRQEPSWRFFERLAQEAERFQTWRGELYLEKHQGTLTSQGRNKWYNRKLEKALRELEFAALLASSESGEDYPREQLEQIWKEVLLYQFHDILPGSSIKRVYDESLARYAVLLQQCETMIEQSYRSVAASVDTAASQTKHRIVFNSLPWTRTSWLPSGEGWQQVCIPAMGYAVIADESSQTLDDVSVFACTQERVLENNLLRLVLDEQGGITSICDKAEQRELIPQDQAANVLSIYRDEDGDAWDFRQDYNALAADRAVLTEMTSVVDGPTAALRLVYRIGESTLIQTIRLTADSPRIDFVTEVDWRERGRMLRTSFPLDLRAEQAQCEIQFGSIARPTHRNTMWDYAKDEICAHHWIDLSEPGYGAALLNDSKYGHRACGNVLDLNLLRSSAFPDPEADLGVHQFTYALLPHVGNHVQAAVYRHGYELNIPLRIIEGEGQVAVEAKAEAQQVSAWADRASFIEVEHPYVMLETIKLAESGDDWILRLYETSGSRVKSTIRTAFPLEAAWIADLLEQSQEALTLLPDNKLMLTFQPYEVITIRLRRNMHIG